MDKALLILKGKRLLLNNPLSFNDPFDFDCQRDEKDINKTRQLIRSFVTITLVVQGLQIPEMREKVLKSPTVKAFVAEYKVLIKTLKIKPRFYGNFGYTTIYKKIGLKRNDFLKKAEESLLNFEKIAENSIERTKQNALVTCFSKRHDSVLMWSHYADSHNGVCFEYERPNYVDFVDVVYSKKRPKIKLYELISFMTAETILAQPVDDKPDDALVREILKPFITKSFEWKYEQEIRFMADSITKHGPKITYEDGNYYYNIGLPTKIFIGCKADGKDKQKLIKFARENKIKVIFLKASKDYYALEQK